MQGSKKDQGISSEIGRPFAEGEYFVPIAYGALPSFAELECEFGCGNVSHLFDGRAFQKHASCANIDETSGDKIFLVKHFGRGIKSEDAIAEMDKQDYRPATCLEAYAFQNVNPELQCQFQIVALGSFVLDDIDRCVVMLDNDFDGRIFGHELFDRRWPSDYRFLFVRKAS